MLRGAVACLKGNPEILARIAGHMERVEERGRVVRSFPSLLESSTLTGHTRDPDSVIE